MNLSTIILIGTIVLLFGYIKFHIDLQFSPDERKWYEKIRFLFPLLVIPIFGAIYYFWNMYPDILIDRDSQTAPMETGAQLAWTIEGLLTPQSSPEPMTKFEEIGSKYGTFGDSYGSLNTLFTGFAFSGLIISIFIQLLELRQTRKELSGQKTALLGQQEEFQKQTQILENQQKIIDEQFNESKKQNFVNQFHALLEQRNNLLNNLVLHEEDKVFSGHKIISKYAEKFREIRNKLVEENNTSEYFEEIWDEFNYKTFGYYDYQLSNYLRIYGIIFYTINNTTFLSDSDKSYYIDVTKALLGIDEKVVLLWLGIFSTRVEQMCCKNALFDQIYHEKLIPIITKHYSIESIGKNTKWLEEFEKIKTDEAA